MKRRDFLLAGGLSASGAIAGPGIPRRLLATTEASPIRWHRSSIDGLFSAVHGDGKPLMTASCGPLDATVRLWNGGSDRLSRLEAGRATTAKGPLRVELSHRLFDCGMGLGEDLLRATITIRNESDQPQQVEFAFESSVQPVPTTTRQQLYLPLNAAALQRDKRFSSLGMQEFLQDCRQAVDREEFECFYLEPMASYPDQRTTRVLLLAPVVHIADAQSPWKVALFTESEKPMRFHSVIGPSGDRIWRAGCVVTIPSRHTYQGSCWLLIHQGDASDAWEAFHRYGHHDVFPRIDWTHRFKVHYYDFLSSAFGKEGRRGDGYDAAVPHFSDFHVGLATQHGYYPYLGDFIRPDRKRWQAMRGDEQGPAEMSIKKMADRIRATRATGAKAGVYMHLTLLDDAMPEYARLADGRLFDSEGQPMRFPWNGPDVKGSCWWMSIASKDWRDHLLQQARWIMELFYPDTICMDETFAGIGYDHAPGRTGPLSPHSIGFFKEMHALVRSFGEDKAFFTSDCSMSGFAMWADGDVGDHAYPRSLGNPLYRQEPVRYLAVLNDKPWRPCAWHFRQMWEHQMALARQVGAGVGVSNGWIEYTGLHRLRPEVRAKIIRDIDSIL